MTNQLNTIFAALSDPTRRAVIERLTAGACSVGTLHADHDLALPTFLRHVRVLEDCGLVTTQKDGRVRIVTLNGAQLALMENWLARQKQDWTARLDRLDALATRMERTRS